MVTGATNSTSATSDSAAKPAIRTNTPDPLSDKNTFLQLLVAQIKNQNPLSPTDGVQFLSQLAQFTQVEQSTAMRDELTSIHDLLSQQVQAQNTTKTKDQTQDKTAAVK